MKKLFKGLLVAGIGAAVGYIVAKKVNEKEENKETTREEAEPLEKEEKVVEKAKEIITVVKNIVKNVVKSDEFFFFDILIGLAILSLYTEINHMKWKQHQLNLYDDYRIIGIAYNTKQLSKDEAISELKEILAQPNLCETIIKLVNEAIDGIKKDIEG